MREEPTEALAAARAVERSIMNDLAPVYRVWVGSAGRNYRDERAEFIDWAVAKLQRSRGDIANLRFLDVGCGTGELLELLHGAGARSLVGFDLSDKMLVETANHVPTAEGVRGVIEQHPFEHARFDVIVTSFTAHHLADLRSLFAMVRQLLAPGGEFFLLDFNSGGWAYEGWPQQAIRVLTSPARFLVRLKNRESRARQPQVPHEFNPVHRLRTRAEFEAAARACELRPSLETHGMLSVWFNQDLDCESELDGRLLRTLRAWDRRLVPEGAGAFVWIHGVSAPDGAEPPSQAGS